MVFVVDGSSDRCEVMMSVSMVIEVVMMDDGTWGRRSIHIYIYIGVIDVCMYVVH